MASLTDRRILIVEDEVILAMELEAILLGAGCGSVALASTVPDALRVVGQEPFDAAVLDVNVQGEASFPVADALDEAGVPCVLLTGHSPQSLPERQRRRTVVGKPYDPEALLATVAAQIERPDRG